MVPTGMAVAQRTGLGGGWPNCYRLAMPIAESQALVNCTPMSHLRHACGNHAAPCHMDEVFPLLPIAHVIPWPDAIWPRCVPRLEQAPEGRVADTSAPREFRRGQW
jgi:hypothetical protein